jgi:hypothetical protein
MKPVQFGLWLRFAKPIYIRTLSYQIFKTLSGESPKQEPEPVMERGVRLRLDKDKMTVSWMPTYCQITSEEIPDISNKKQYIDRIISVLETINGIAKIEKLRSKRLLTYWILLTPQYDFVSLERKYREMMITKNDISNTAYDSTAIFDIRRDKWILHHQSGPMEPQQLQQDYLSFKLDNLPKTFIFLETSLLDNTMIEYSRGEVYSFMERALELCISHMEEFNRICEGCL